MHRTRHRAPVKRDSWYIGWKEKLGGGVKELESWKKKKKNNSARVNERESTGRGEKNLVFFFTRAGEKLRGKFRIESCREKKQWKQVRVERSEKEKIIYSNDCERERDRRRKSILAVSIYFSCFSTLRFSLGNMGRKRGEARLFTPALSRLRNAAAV